jgi:predicted nucleotidyltransferase component of viral defense system
VTQRTPVDIGASVRQRLLNRARDGAESHQDLLIRYAIERFLFRLGESRHRERFILKGAMLFQLWIPDAARPTRDLDMLGFGDVSPEDAAAAVRDILAATVAPDGVDFYADELRAELIGANTQYPGVRIRVPGSIGGAKVALQIDIGVGDAVEPPPNDVTYPTLLDYPAPRIRAYPREAAIAEKLHTMVVRGVANSRVRDYFDIWALAQQFPFEGTVLPG